MSDLKVNFSTLAGAAADINAGAGQIESTLGDMDSQLQALRANWTGESASAYEAAKAKWTAAITDMRTLLAQIGSAVDTSGQEYQSTERTNTNRWA